MLYYYREVQKNECKRARFERDTVLVVADDEHDMFDVARHVDDSVDDSVGASETLTDVEPHPIFVPMSYHAIVLFWTTI
jgi:hypothetical protein